MAIERHKTEAQAEQCFSLPGATAMSGGLGLLSDWPQATHFCPWIQPHHSTKPMSDFRWPVLAVIFRLGPGLSKLEVGVHDSY